jgi:hypothetical protein
VAVKTFAVAWRLRFRKISLRQSGPNHARNNYLQFCDFEVFRAVAGLK